MFVGLLDINKIEMGKNLQICVILHIIKIYKKPLIIMIMKY